MFWTGVLYFDYSWFREQTCLIICPYGRLQSALIDQDTVIGEDPEADRARGFRITDKGITLVTPDLLGQQLHHTR